MKGLRALGFPALAAAIGVLSAAVLAAFAGENPFHVLAVLFRSAFGSRFGLGYTLYYMTPLLLTVQSRTRISAAVNLGFQSND